MPEQIDLEEYLATIGGVTYDPAVDGDRLGAQMIRVLDCMLDGHWRSLRQIAAITDDPEASISARLRDVRKIWGEDAMESRRVPGIDPKRGVWQYKINVRPTPLSREQK